MQIPYIDLRILDDEELRQIQGRLESVFRDGQFILGSEVDKFEAEFARFCKVRYAAGLHSGTDSLHLVLKAFDIGPGDEVITVGNSFIATIAAIVATGARPVLVDVNYDDMLIDVSSIENAITAKTKAIIPVHLTGLPCEMEEIIEIASRHGLFVIEDACQAVGAMYKGQAAGSIGHAGCFSFHPLKNLAAAGDGGAVTTSDPELYRRIVCLRNHGLLDRDHAARFGFNSRLDSLQAALLRYRLEKLDSVSNRKREIAYRYGESLRRLKEKGDIDYCLDDERRISVFHLFVIKADSRDKLKQHLSSHGISTKIHYPLPLHKQKAYLDLFGSISLPVTELLAEKMLSLPIWNGMTDDMVDTVCKKIMMFYK